MYCSRNKTVKCYRGIKCIIARHIMYCIIIYCIERMKKKIIKKTDVLNETKDQLNKVAVNVYSGSFLIFIIISILFSKFHASVSKEILIIINRQSECRLNIRKYLLNHILFVPSCIRIDVNVRDEIFPNLFRPITYEL